jgi:hypothetical protein
MNNNSKHIKEIFLISILLLFAGVRSMLAETNDNRIIKANNYIHYNKLRVLPDGVRRGAISLRRLGSFASLRKFFRVTNCNPCNPVTLYEKRSHYLKNGSYKSRIK